MTAKLMLVLFLLLPVSVFCKEKSCEDFSAENRNAIVLKIRDFKNWKKRWEVLDREERKVVNY